MLPSFPTETPPLEEEEAAESWEAALLALAPWPGATGPPRQMGMLVPQLRMALLVMRVRMALGQMVPRLRMAGFLF